MRRVGKSGKIWCQEYRDEWERNVRFQRPYTEQDNTETYLKDEKLKEKKNIYIG